MRCPRIGFCLAAALVLSSCTDKPATPEDTAQKQAAQEQAAEKRALEKRELESGGGIIPNLPGPFALGKSVRHGLTGQKDKARQRKNAMNKLMNR